MADFSLVPVPRVLLVQAGIFIANTIIIKKLLVEPYLTTEGEAARLHRAQASRGDGAASCLTARIDGTAGTAS